MPQPRIHRRGELIIGPRALDEHPELAHLMAMVITRWTVLETHMAMTFATMMPSETETAHEIYHAFFDHAQRTRVFLTVAKAKLSPELAVQAEAYGRGLRKVAEDRNAVAHSLWCYSPSVPKCLCTISQKTITVDFIRRMREVMANPTMIKPAGLDYALGAKITPYSITDFKNMLSRMESFDQIGLALGVSIASYLFPLNSVSNLENVTDEIGK